MSVNSLFYDKIVLFSVKTNVRSKILHYLCGVFSNLGANNIE